MAVGDDRARDTRQRLTRVVARFPVLLGRAAIVRRLAQPIGNLDPWTGVKVLRQTMSSRDALRVVLDPSDTPSRLLAALLRVRDSAGRIYAQRAANSIVRRHPFDAKAVVLSMAK